jgi:hypothetical protein
VGKLPFREILLTELENFRVKINVNTGHETYEAWREREHDDLVLATALACWYCLKQKKRTLGVRLIIGKIESRPLRY